MTAVLIVAFAYKATAFGGGALVHILLEEVAGKGRQGSDYAKAVDAYKMSLRNNPADHETRYNLALAQKMLKDQQNQQDQDQNQDQNKDQQQKQDQKQDQNKDKQNDQKKDDQKDQQQPPKPEKQDNQMSKENAEQLLNSVMQDEKDVHCFRSSARKSEKATKSYARWSLRKRLVI